MADSPKLHVYIGTPDLDDEYYDFIYCDLRLDGIDLPVFVGETPVEELGENSLIDEIGRALNNAKLVSDQLSVPIILDDNIQECAEEIREGLYKTIVKIYEL